MFVIASTGRCATEALCAGLGRFSDHEVEHEPEPRLLREAFRKHRGLDHRTPTLEARLRFLGERDGRRYGLSFRAPTLLGEVCASAPSARFLIVVREPLSYVVSAHRRGVLCKGGDWDRYRIMPRDQALDIAPLAEQIAWHWAEVNRRLLEFCEAAGGVARVVILERLEDQVVGWARFLGVRVTDAEGLREYLSTRPNASTGIGLPEGFEERTIRGITEPIWDRVLRAAERWDVTTC